MLYRKISKETSSQWRKTGPRFESYSHQLKTYIQGFGGFAGPLVLGAASRNGSVYLAKTCYHRVLLQKKRACLGISTSRKFNLWMNLMSTVYIIFGLAKYVWHLKIINLEIPPQYAHMFGNLAPVSLTAANSIGGGRQSGASGWGCGAGGNPQHAPLEAPGPSLLLLEWRLDPAPRRVGGTVLAGSHQVENFTLEFPNQSGWRVDGKSQVIVIIGLISWCPCVFEKNKRYYSDSCISLVCALCSLAGSWVLSSQWNGKKNKWGQWHVTWIHGTCSCNDELLAIKFRQWLQRTRGKSPGKSENKNNDNNKSSQVLL